MQIAIEIPDAVLGSGRWTPEALRAELSKEVALTLYRSGAVSEGKAAEIAGMHRFAFSALLGERGVERNYGAEDLRHDLEWAEKCDEIDAKKNAATRCENGGRPRK